MTLSPSSTAPAPELHPHLAQGRSRAAVFGVLWSTLHTLVPTVTSAAVFFIAAFYLSPADFGLVGLAASLVMIALAVSPIAFGEALVQRADLSREHVDSVFWLTAAAAAVLYLPFVVAAGGLARLTGVPEVAAILPILALKIPMELLAAVPSALIVRAMRFRLVALRTTVATLAGSTICLAMLMAGYGYWALVVSQVANSIVVCAMAYWVSGWRPGHAISRTALAEVFRYGIFASGTRMLGTLRLDHLILGTLAGTQVLGLFVFAQRLYTMLTQLVSGAFSSVAHALFSSLQGDTAKTRRGFAIASFACVSISLPIFVFLAIVIEDLVGLLPNPDWHSAVFAVQAFCAMGILASISVVQGAFLKSQGKADWWFYYQLVQQATTLAAILLSYQAGLDAMMMVIAIKSLLIWPVSVAMTARLLDLRILTYLSDFRAPALATLVMAAAVIILMQHWDPGAPLVRFAGVSVVGGAAYLSVLLVLSRARLRDFRDLIRSKGRASP